MGPISSLNTYNFITPNENVKNTHHSSKLLSIPTFLGEWKSSTHILDTIKASPLVSTHALRLLNQIRLQIPLSPFHLLLAWKLKDLRSLLTLPVSYSAVGTGAAHHYAKPWHQNKLCLPNPQTLLCGLLLHYLARQQTFSTDKLKGKLKQDDSRLNSHTCLFRENAFSDLLFLTMSVLLSFLRLFQFTAYKGWHAAYCFPEQILASGPTPRRLMWSGMQWTWLWIVYMLSTEWLMRGNGLSSRNSQYRIFRHLPMHDYCPGSAMTKSGESFYKNKEITAHSATHIQDYLTSYTYIFFENPTEKVYSVIKNYWCVGEYLTCPCPVALLLLIINLPHP